MATNWFYLRNPFDNVTKSSFKRMLLMGRDHRDKLGQYIADPDISNLYATLNLAFVRFEEAYSDVHANWASYQGDTQTLEELMQELRSNKIKQWDIWIQNVYLDDTAAYKKLLPNRRNPFQSGAYEIRIDALKTLAKSLQAFPMLSAVLTDVQTFIQQIDTTRTVQQQTETLDQSLRITLEKARVNLAQEMHRVLGFLIYKHYTSPSDVSLYYELKYLQSPDQGKAVTYTRYVVSANSRITLFDGLLTLNSYINLRVKTVGASIKVFTSSDTAAAPPIDVMIAVAGQEQSFYANELTDNNGFNWLLVVNDSTADVEIEVAKIESELE